MSTSIPTPTNLTPAETLKDLHDLARGLNSPMFASRETIGEAYDYMAEIAKASDNPMAVFTAVQVLINTISNVILEQTTKHAQDTNLH